MDRMQDPTNLRRKVNGISQDATDNIGSKTQSSNDLTHFQTPTNGAGGTEVAPPRLFSFVECIAPYPKRPS